METLFRLANMFRNFVVDVLVPFMTSSPDDMELFYLTWSVGDGFQLRNVSVPWLFGDVSFAEFILVGGLIGFIVIRFLRVLWDALPIA